MQCIRAGSYAADLGLVNTIDGIDHSPRCCACQRDVHRMGILNTHGAAVADDRRRQSPDSHCKRIMIGDTPCRIYLSYGDISADGAKGYSD